MSRTPVLIGVLVLLAGISIYFWSSQSEEQVDPTFAKAKQSFHCPHCNGDFEMTGEELSDVLAASETGGVICPLCGKDIDNFIAAVSRPPAEIPVENEPDVEVPVKTVGTRKPRGR